jgi:plastin-1
MVKGISLLGRTPSSGSITGFKDPVISDGCFLLQLLEAISPGTVDLEILNEPVDAETRKRTAAKYAISVARKLGATIFLLPEDIVEVKPRMIMTFVASLMAIHQQKA